MLRIASEADALAREDLAFALSVVLLGMLMMVVRRNAVSMVVGFMSLENGLILAATGAKGMPLVVEISVAFSVLVALVVIGVFLFRISERFETVDAHALDRFQGRPAMTGWPNATIVILALPAATAAAARRSAVLSAVGRAQRRLRLRHFPRLGLAAGRRAAAERLHSRRRSQRRLHRAQHVRRLHRERVQRDLYRARDRDRAADADASALLSRDVSVPPVLDEPRADRQQHRADVGGDRARHADDGADGRHLPHAGGDRGGVEIFHPRQRRHRARAVRHDPRLHGRAARRRRRASRACCGRA